MSDDVNDGMKAWQDATNERMRAWRPTPAAPVLASVSTPAAPVLASVRKALEKIACNHVTEQPLWWQLEARRALASLPAPEAAPTPEDDDETYEIGKRDGYESAIQDLDLATGGDGEFRGSTFPGETVDVPVMKARIIERFESKIAAPTREEIIHIVDEECFLNDFSPVEKTKSRKTLWRVGNIIRDRILALKSAPQGE